MTVSSPDISVPDLPDAGFPDTGLPDAGLSDTGLSDTGLPDTGFGTAWTAPVDAPPALRIETLPCGARLVRTRGPMDRRGSVRLLRLIDAELTTVLAGRRRVRHLLLDLSGVSHWTRGGPEVLGHVRYACARAGIELLVVGCVVTSVAPLTLRSRIDRCRTYPSVASALDAVARERAT